MYMFRLHKAAIMSLLSRILKDSCHVRNRWLMLKDRMFYCFMGNISPKFPRCAEIDGRVTGRSVCGILQRLLECLGVFWGGVSTHVAIALIHLLVTVST